jgi:hypothetical protein
LAKCGLCFSKKGKRYCSPLDKAICPICCAESRGIKVSCDDNCRHLEGLLFQQKRAEDKEFADLMNNVGHGQFDDIFQNPEVAFMAYEVESLLRDIYVCGEIEMTDTMVDEALKKVYSLHFQGKHMEPRQFDELSKRLLEQFDTNSMAWKANMDEQMIGDVYLRLMISIRNMRGGRMGEYGYLNYLKNNLDQGHPDDTFIVEDKFGNKKNHKTT